MTHFPLSDNARPGALLSLVLAFLLVGCSDGRTTAPDPSETRANSTMTAAEMDDELAGREWGEAPRDLEMSGRRRAASARESYWSIILATHTGPQAAQSAAVFLQQIGPLSPELANAGTYQSPRGSLTVVGRYADPSDPAAQAALKRIKEFDVNGTRPFARAILIPIDPAQNLPPSARHPHDLMSVRATYPRVHPLYTLQVAVWGDFGTGSLSLNEIQRQAEAYTAELRTQGFESFYHHEPTPRLSIVTVGVFGADALDPQSGLYSADVEFLVQRFPAHLVNGEPLEEPLSRRQPSLGTRVQPPRLVQVPKIR